MVCPGLSQYQMAANAPDAFHDITEGDNICPEEFCGPQCKGYVATKGWVSAHPSSITARRLTTLVNAAHPHHIPLCVCELC